MTWARIDGPLRLLIQRSMRGLNQHRDNVVLVGGLVKYFYEHHPLFRSPSAPLRATVDLDVALQPAAIADGQHLHEQLSEAQLIQYVVLDDAGRPIEQRYHLLEDGAARAVPTCLELVAPMPPPSRRPPPPSQSVLSPARLRYVEHLLRDPIAVDVPDLGQLQLPHPLAYAIQKTLIRTHRERSATNTCLDAPRKVCVGCRGGWAANMTRSLPWRAHLRAPDGCTGISAATMRYGSLIAQ
jgi:Nucleotidyltransferase